MTRPQPPGVQRNFILKKAWNNIYEKRSHAVFLGIGEPGTGKSMSFLGLCDDFDENFTMDNVVYSIEEFLKLDKSGKLKRGSAVLFDEIAGSEQGADSRSSMSNSNKIASYIATTFREKGYLIFYVAPRWKQIDANVRKVGITGVFEFKRIDFDKKKAVAAFYWTYINPRSTDSNDAPYFVKPRIFNEKLQEYVYVDEIETPKPSKELVKAYLTKKKNFLDMNRDRWLAKFAVVEGKNAPVDEWLPDILIKAKPIIEKLIRKRKGKMSISSAALSAHFGVSKYMGDIARVAILDEIEKGNIKVSQDWESRV